MWVGIDLLVIVVCACLILMMAGICDSSAAIVCDIPLYNEEEGGVVHPSHWNACDIRNGKYGV